MSGRLSASLARSRIKRADSTVLAALALAQPHWRACPRAPYDCSLSQLAAEPAKIPKLLRAYLTLGAKICGPPALDRQFKTIDFLTLLDLQTMPLLARQKFLGV